MDLRDLKAAYFHRIDDAKSFKLKIISIANKALYKNLFTNETIKEDTFIKVDRTHNIDIDSLIEYQDLKSYIIKKIAKIQLEYNIKNSKINYVLNIDLKVYYLNKDDIKFKIDIISMEAKY